MTSSALSDVLQAAYLADKWNPIMAICPLWMCSAKEAPCPHPSYGPLHAHGCLVSTRFARTGQASPLSMIGHTRYGNTTQCRSCVAGAQASGRDGEAERASIRGW